MAEKTAVPGFDKLPPLFLFKVPSTCKSVPATLEIVSELVKVSTPPSLMVTNLAVAAAATVIACILRMVIPAADEVGANVAVIHELLSGDDCQLAAVPQLPDATLLLK